MGPMERMRKNASSTDSSKALSLLREIASSRMMRECLYATSSRKDADLVVVPLDLSSGVGGVVQAWVDHLGNIPNPRAGPSFSFFRT